jgi:TolA protein
MPAPRRDRLEPEWDPRWTRMLGLSAVVHVAIVAGLVLLAEGSGPRPAPLAAYTVEIADPSALGGRLPPGKAGRDLAGGATRPVPPKGAPGAPGAEVARTEPPKPEPKPEPAKAAEKKPEPKPEPPKVAEKRPAPKPEAPKVAEKKPEPKPEPAKAAEKKPEPKPEPAKVAEKKPAPKPEPPEAAEKAPEPAGAKTAAKAGDDKPPTEKSADAKAGAGAKPGSPSGEDIDREYAALGDRWRERTNGGGLGGSDTGSGPVGSGGGAGGGQLVGLEFIAYRQQVIDAIKARWTNVIARPGLVATVRFQIDRDGAVTGIHLVQDSGSPAFDASAIRAVELANPLAPPPGRYAEQFRDFQMEFHSEERGGGTG